jgi:uncharacterized peroxidase-related enzyme
MPHITLNSDEPGVRGLFLFRPETARPLNELVDVLLRAPGSLTPGERELIAAYVSGLNQCNYCCSAHSAFAAAQLPGGMPLVEEVRAEAVGAPISAKLRALLKIAAAVQRSGKEVSEQDVAAAREQGATDLEIHDTVLIAAVFCMYNRYVDGLATALPEDPGFYEARAQKIVEFGYLGALAQVQAQLNYSGTSSSQRTLLSTSVVVRVFGSPRFFWSVRSVPSGSRHVCSTGSYAPSTTG